MKTITTAFILWAVILVFASLTANGQEGTINEGRFTLPLVITDSTDRIETTSGIFSDPKLYSIKDGSDGSEGYESYSMSVVDIRWTVCDSSDCSGFEIMSDQIIFYTPDFSLRIDSEGNFYFDGELIVCDDEVANKMREFLIEISKDKYPKFNH